MAGDYNNSSSSLKGRAKVDDEDLLARTFDADDEDKDKDKDEDDYGERLSGLKDHRSTSSLVRGGWV